jgi:uncharacterized protein
MPIARTSAPLHGARMTTPHVETVKTIYEAFGKGDVPTILARMSDDVDWDFAYPDHPVPWLQRRRGKDGVAAFLTAVATGLDFHSFVPVAILGEGVVVVALCDLECTVKATGRRIVEREEAHIWHFDGRGSVVRFRHCADTLQQAHAARL